MPWGGPSRRRPGPAGEPHVRTAGGRGAASGGAERHRLDPSHVRRDFRNAIKDAEGVNPAEWTPRELRNSFVSLLSDNGLPLEEISRLVGHSSTATTEAVYRKQIRPVLQGGAATMDRIFKQE
ncbi:tyrosine-type recombinase/integrase [Microbispora rosea]|uniref:tyrosine-type recombinase/integrase n=1 Tax=Microbispora rosea TaxID=58117 RepID=UPI00379FA4AE